MHDSDDNRVVANEKHQREEREKSNENEKEG